MPARTADPACRSRSQVRAGRRGWTSLVGLIVLMALSGGALRVFGGLPRMPEGTPSVDAMHALLAGSTLPLQPIVSLLVGIAWLLWLWILVSLVLELVLHAIESLARGAGWLRSARGLTDRFTVPIVRRTVAAAFAVQILSRSVPVAAAEPLSPADVSVAAPHAAAQRLAVVAPMISEPSAPTSALYRVRAGDTLWTIAEHAYGSGTEYRRVVAANLGRRMPDGQTFTARGVIAPGWELVLPPITADVEQADGEAWYTVQPGDTLCGIAARVLKDENKWSVLLELNEGATSPDGAHVLANPNLIWPGLRLRLPDPQTPRPLEATPPDSVTSDEADPAEPSQDADADPADRSAGSPLLAHAPQPSPDTTVALRSSAEEPGVADPDLTAAASPTVSAIVPPQEPEAEPLRRTLHPLPPVAMDEASDPTPAATGVPEPPVGQPEIETPPVVPIAGAAGALAIAAGAGAFVLRRRQHLRPLSREPESDVVVTGGYAAAELTHAFTRGLQPGASDPVAAVVSQVRAFLHEYNLQQVGVVAVRHGRSSTTLTLSAGVSEQAVLVDLAPEIGARLDSQAEAYVTGDEDVLLRLVRTRKGRLLSTAEAERSAADLCVPLGALPDHQILSGAWPALGNLLIASHPGHGADVILTSLLATLAARCSPDQLRMWMVAEPRALPAPLGAMPHLQRTLDPSNTTELDRLLADLRHELDHRATETGGYPELVVVLAELTQLRERSAELELLMPHAAALGVRVIAATSMPTEAVQLPAVTQFATRMVLHMEDEALSVGMLGVADAAFLGGGGRLLLRIDNREPVELFGFQVTAEHLERLVRVMRTAYASAAPPAPSPAPVEPGGPIAEQTIDAAPSESQAEPERGAPQLPESSIDPAEQTGAGGPPLQVLCFGGPRVLYNGQQVWPGRARGDVKPWEFLLFLACQPIDGVARDQLVAALWPDSDVDKPAHRIRQLRYRLRKLLGEDKDAQQGDGIFGSARLRLDPAVIYSDAQEFLELVPSKRTAPAPPTLMIERLERARALYTGDLLEGPEARRYAWAEDRDGSGVTLREHFRRLYQSATLSLADLYAANDLLPPAIDAYRDLTEMDPGDERAWLALFRIHAGRGDRVALVREERRMRSKLRQLASDTEGKVVAGMDEPTRETALEFERLLKELDGSARQPAAV